MKRPAPPETLLVLDLATTGFSPANDVILECAALLVGCTPEFPILDHTTVLVRAGADVTAPDFHSALLQECQTSENAVTVGQLEGYLMAGPWTSARAVCNRALDFEMEKFLPKHMPLLHGALKKKLAIELKALEAVAVAAGAPRYVSDTPRTFRASDEVVSAYEELRHYAGLMGVPR